MLATFGVSLAVASVLIALAFVVRRAIRSGAARRRAHRAAAGEARAAALLEAAGFAIEGAQVRARYPLIVDGGERWFDVRADYVVVRGQERFVAEVKTGEIAPRLELPATRRQLLEYGIAFEADGVLLVDVEADRIHALALPWRSSARPRQSARAPSLVGVFVGCAVIGTLVALLR